MMGRMPGDAWLGPIIIGYMAFQGIKKIAYSCGPAQIVGIPLAIKSKMLEKKLKKEMEQLNKTFIENRLNGIETDNVLNQDLEHTNYKINECNNNTKKHLVSMVPVVGALGASYYY
jgi:hypothetical protein